MYNADEINKRMWLFANTDDELERTGYKNYVLEAMLEEGLILHHYEKFLQYNPKNNAKMTVRDTVVVKELFKDIYLNVLLECVSKYDPTKGKLFLQYFFGLLKVRRNDIFRKSEYKLISITDSYDGKPDDEEESRGRGDTVLKVYDDASDEASLLLLCAAEIIQMKERLANGNILTDGKRKSLKNRIIYYKLFYTDMLAMYLKDMPNERNIRLLVYNDEMVMDNTDTGFLDYFMKNECRTVMDIYKSNVKCLGEIDCEYTDKEDKNICKFPLKDKIILGYSEKIDKTSSLSKISIFKKEFYSAVRSGVIMENDGGEMLVSLKQEDIHEQI